MWAEAGLGVPVPAAAPSLKLVEDSEAWGGWGAEAESLGVGSETQWTSEKPGLDPQGGGESREDLAQDSTREEEKAKPKESKRWKVHSGWSLISHFSDGKEGAREGGACPEPHAAVIW